MVQVSLYFPQLKACYFCYDSLHYESQKVPGNALPTE